MLDVDLEVVLEVLADTGEVGHDLDAERPEWAAARRPRAEQLRRVDRAAGEDDVACEDPLRRARRPVQATPTRAPALEQHAADERAGSRP